jgi:NO-binding membrane sensor protein with MHYT domain
MEDIMEDEIEQVVRMSSHNATIVALSFGLAFIGAYSAINLCDQFRICKREVPKLLSPRAFMFFMAITVGGVCMWAMHFVAMSDETYYAPNGVKIDIRYRIDYTIVSLIIPVILCYCGIYVCSKDRAFTEEKSDVLGEFVKNAEHMSIQELKAMKSANYVLAVALFRSLDRIILGGFMTAIGVCVMHFLGIFVSLWNFFVIINK